MRLAGCISDPTSKHAFYLSIVGCLLEGAFTAMGIAGYVWLGSALLLLYGMENFVDFISSAVVLWRFYAPGELTKEREKLLNDREDRAAVAISFLIILLGCLVIPAAVADLQAGAPGDEEVDEDLDIVIAIALCSVVIFSFLTYLKLYYAKVLNSESLHKDGLCSVIGLLLSLLIFSNSWVISSHPEFWKLDPYLAIACGGIALSIGTHGIFRAIFTKKLSIFTLSFWRGEQVASVPADNEKNVHKLSEVV